MDAIKNQIIGLSGQVRAGSRDPCCTVSCTRPSCSAQLLECAEDTYMNTTRSAEGGQAHSWAAVRPEPADAPCVARIGLRARQARFHRRPCGPRARAWPMHGRRPYTLVHVLLPRTRCSSFSTRSKRRKRRWTRTTVRSRRRWRSSTRRSTRWATCSSCEIRDLRSEILCGNAAAAAAALLAAACAPRRAARQSRVRATSRRALGAACRAAHPHPCPRPQSPPPQERARPAPGRAPGGPRIHRRGGALPARVRRGADPDGAGSV